jgi:prophage DNA circulation protein
MSWRTDYRQGSFREVPFRTVNRDQSGGRNGQLHEFPSASEDGSDHKPWFEDMGRKARGFDFTCWVAGPDHHVRASALIGALESRGPGTLIDPYRGEMTVAMLDYSCTESGEEGGISEFSIRFVETSGEPAPLANRPDTQSNAQAAALAAKQAAPEQFAQKFSVEKVTAFVEDAAVILVEGTALLVQIAAAPMGGAGAVLRAFDAGLRLLPPSARALVRQPLQLGQSIVGLMSSLSALSSNPRQRVAAAKMMAAFGSDAKPVTGNTPPRQTQAGNQAAYIGMVRTLAATELVSALSEMRFSSYEEAVAERNAAAQLIDALAFDAADALDDDRWQALRELRAAMVADLTARGANLARVYQYTSRATEPALVIARRLYDVTSTIEVRAAELVERNEIAHPGFVAGGAVITVLQEQAA